MMDNMQNNSDSVSLILAACGKKACSGVRKVIRTAAAQLVLDRRHATTGDFVHVFIIADEPCKVELYSHLPALLNATAGIMHLHLVRLDCLDPIPDLSKLRNAMVGKCFLARLFLTRLRFNMDFRNMLYVDADVLVASSFASLGEQMSWANKTLYMAEEIDSARCYG